MWALMFFDVLGDIRSHTLLISISPARTAASSVKSMDLPARSPLDKDLAWSEASSTSSKPSSGGSSKGPGLITWRWVGAVARKKDDDG